VIQQTPAVLWARLSPHPPPPAVLCPLPPLWRGRRRSQSAPHPTAGRLARVRCTRPCELLRRKTLWCGACPKKNDKTHPCKLGLISRRLGAREGFLDERAKEME
jgi:hypothetical protein